MNLGKTLLYSAYVVLDISSRKDVKFSLYSDFRKAVSDVERLCGLPRPRYESVLPAT